MNYPTRKADLLEFRRRLLASIIAEAITENSRADITTKALSYRVRTLTRAMDQLHWKIRMVAN